MLYEVITIVSNSAMKAPRSASSMEPEVSMATTRERVSLESEGSAKPRARCLRLGGMKA